MEPRRRVHLLGLVALLAASLPGTAKAKLFLAQKDALRLAFPEGTAVEKKTVFLSPEQVAEAQSLGKVKFDSAVWTYYEGSKGSEPAGYAYFDRVTIRTMPATVMAALDAQGRLRFLEILSFDEPEDYLPARGWLGLFAGRDLDSDLRLKGGIRNVAGATLSAAALTDSARRVLALHRILHKSRISLHKA